MGRTPSVGQVVAGGGFLAAAVYNLAVSRQEADEVLARMENDAWLPPWRWLVGGIVRRHARAAVTVVACFEATAGVCMLATGRVGQAGLRAGAAWAVVTTPLLPPAQAAGNLGLAPALLVVARRASMPRLARADGGT